MRTAPWSDRGTFADTPDEWTVVATAQKGADIALAAAFLGDDLVAGSGDGDLVVLDGANGTVRSELPSGYSKVVDVAVSADEQLVLARASSGDVTVSEPRLGVVRGRLPAVHSCLATFIGNEVVVIADDLRRYRITRDMPHVYDLGSGITSLDFDPSGAYLAATSGYQLEVRRVTDGTRVLRQDGVFSASGNHTR